MKTVNFLFIALVAIGFPLAQCFSIHSRQVNLQMKETPKEFRNNKQPLKMSSNTSVESSRRDVFFKCTKVTFFSSMIIGLGANPSPSLAEATVTTEEFQTILKDSYRSIKLVEFSGPKSETCRVKLIDGTTFTISDLVESPTDPRSPLKLQSECRGYGIPTKNLQLEVALSGTPKKKKVYMNSRVQEAAGKEAEKRERMKIDEENRLRALYLMEEEEAKKLQEIEQK